VAKRKPPRSQRARPRKLTEALVKWCRKRYARGNPLMLLIAVDACLRTGSKVPLWAAQKFCDQIDKWLRAQVKTLDEAFGVQRPAGKHFDRRKKREALRPYIVLRVLDLNKFQGVPIGGGLFEQVARELKVSAPYVSDVYYERDSRALRALRPILQNVAIS
jgi:hypothetical protein